MTKTATAPYDVAEHIRTREEMVAYLEASIKESGGDDAFVAKALGDIARAKGMAQVASDAGLSRESLYKALSGAQSDVRDRPQGSRRAGAEAAGRSGAGPGRGRTERGDRGQPASILTDVPGLNAPEGTGGGTRLPAHARLESVSSTKLALVGVSDNRDPWGEGGPSRAGRATSTSSSA